MAQWDTAGVSDQKARAVGRSVGRSVDGFSVGIHSAFCFFFLLGVRRRHTLFDGGFFRMFAFWRMNREGTRTEGKSHERGKVCRGWWSLRMTFLFSLNVMAVGQRFTSTSTSTSTFTF